MTSRDTEQLIASLTGDLAPVRPLRPPLPRALLWLAPVGLVIGFAVLRSGRLR